MKELSDAEKSFFIDLLKYSPRLHNGYYCFQPRNLRYGNKRYKRSRVIMQLHLGMSLDIFEYVHHEDNDKTNDSIENLKVISPSEHSSHHYNENVKTGKFDSYNKYDKIRVKNILNNTLKYFNDYNKINYYKIGKMSGDCGVITKKKIFCNFNSFNYKIKKALIEKHF